MKWLTNYILDTCTNYLIDYMIDMGIFSYMEYKIIILIVGKFTAYTQYKISLLFITIMRYLSALPSAPAIPWIPENPRANSKPPFLAEYRLSIFSLCSSLGLLPYQCCGKKASLWAVRSIPVKITQFSHLFLAFICLCTARKSAKSNIDIIEFNFCFYTIKLYAFFLLS